MMWLIQLYKANNNITQNVYSTASCERDNLENYINPDDYRHELSLCNDWDFSEKKKLLILGKGQGTMITIPKDERMIQYHFVHYNSNDLRNKNSQFIIFEYKTGSDFLMDFYVYTKINGSAVLPTGITISGIRDLIEYIRNKTLNLSFGNNDTPKYRIHFDDTCKYYIMNNDMAIIIKKPFLFLFMYRGQYSYSYVDVTIYATPKLIDDINNHDSTNSNYDIDTDHSLSIDQIVGYYFNANDTSGIQYSNVSINDCDDNNAFGCNLIRAFSGPINYEGPCNINIADISFVAYMHSYSYASLDAVPIYIYFPLLRPKLDTDGYFYSYPQYDPLDEDSKIQYLQIYMGLSNAESIEYFRLWSIYIRYDYYYPCSIVYSGQLPSWNSSEWCNLTVPFRFVEACNSSELTTDNWSAPQAINNANYLFMISKSPSSDTYSIKGVGCNEETQPLDFNATYTFYFNLSVNFFTSLRAITFSGFGYEFDRISETLSSEVRLENSETCFVLFSDKLIDDENDFINIHTAVREALPNSILCYFGDDSKIPRDLKNKVIHSDAIVTDLDTNEQMPLVIKYIRYAKRLHELFNVGAY